MLPLYKRYMKDISQKVYDFLIEIPKGKVVSYKTIATRFDIHPRTAASILSKNTQPDVYPCFRVLHSDGSLSGYNLGVDEKLRRLEADGVPIRDGKVSREYFWDGTTF